ncbi:hypothetical protein [Desertivirga xinjiangensis]|uniref:hypothetical protein n=1 Tax=Desertivirga xinjiangensis TaxID=539206 RepID=UPI00210DCF87|nr:hypothetical protein [Pedobacter xinjiangensis]
MKRTLLLICAAALTYSASAQFTPGNLAIYRYGNGDALAPGARVPVFVDEYTPAGNKVKTIEIPETASGSNLGIKGLGLTSGGVYEAEGFPVLSRDGQKLTILGYDAAQTTPPFRYVAGIIDAAGTVTSNTVIEEAIGAPRSAVVEGTRLYANGNSGGVKYKEIGAAGASQRVSDGQNAPRVLTIANTIYNGIEAIRLYAPIGGTQQTASLPAVSPLPTSQVVFSTTPSFPGAALPFNVHQAIALKAYGRTILYILDDGDPTGSAPLIRKYRTNQGATTWLELGSISVPATTKSLTAKIDDTGVTLFFSTLGTPNSANSQLFTLHDDFTDSNDENKMLSGAPTLIATAPANTTFRGVTFAPGTNVLPVTLSSFEAKASSNAIRLSWSTASEQNSSHFDILRSVDGKDYQKIGEKKASGNSDANTNYTYVDENPYPGVNYYKLQQFDMDGKFTFYGPKQVQAQLDKTNFSIYASASKAAADIYVYSTIRQKGRIRILNIGGQILQEQTLNLDKGLTKVTMPVTQVQSGVQIAVLNAQSEVITKKFLWQQ